MIRKEKPVLYVKVKWQACTDKAILFELVFCYRSGARVSKYILAPKSLLKGDALPYWFVSKKYQEQVKPDMTGWLVLEDLEKEQSAVVDLPDPPSAA